MHIAICIATFHRPDLLRKLLTGLCRLEFQKASRPEVEVIVVDNDPLGSANDVCQTVSLPFATRYVIEPRRGIAHARNRIIQEVREAEFLAFIDDDEVPSPQWLDELLWTQREYGADVVAGPVLPEFLGDVPSWIKQGGFFDRPDLPTGAVLEKCGAGNVLVSQRIFTRVPGFDERFQLTGGEDTHFFLRARQAGYAIVWSHEAIARESIPHERANLSWILRRAYQTGNCWALCESSLDGRLRVRALRFVKSWAYVAKGLATALASSLVGRAALARSLQAVCVGVGMLAGMAGRRYLAYQGVNAGVDTKTGVCNDQSQS
jgi:glycosyltransferase involved in cell wall biosynthesis